VAWHFVYHHHARPVRETRRTEGAPTPQGGQCHGEDLSVLEEDVMAMKLRLRPVMFAACLALAALSGAARAQEIPLITGEHWTKSTDEQKKAYLVGIANVVQVETAYHGANPPPDAQSVVPRMVKGLKGHTLDGVREALNKWYAAHPDQVQRPVIETIWFEMVVPGLKTAK
jgi:hypothetical protein